MDNSYVGRSYPPTPPYEVAREKIREFVDAIGVTDPVYRDPEAARALGFPDVIAPPTFPVVITMKAAQQIIDDPQLGLDYRRVVHGEQRFQYARPIHAGERLSCIVVIEDVASRGGLGFLTTRSEVTTLDGEPVVTAWSKLVVRGSDG